MHIDLAWRTLLVASLGASLAPLDSAVNIALPAITQAFAVPVPAIQWVIICYVSTYAILVINFGRWGDASSHRNIFILGTLWSSGGLIFCAIATDYQSLIIARIAQGIGTALVLAVSPALVTLAFPIQQQTKVLATYNFLFAAAFAIGPLVGGWLIQLAGWSAVFWFRVPIALVSALLAWWLLPTDKRALQKAHTASVWHWFQQPSFILINTAHTLSQLAAFTVLFLCPYYLVLIFNNDTVSAGLMLGLSPLAMMAASYVTQRLSQHWSAPNIAQLGTICLTLALLMISFWSVQPNLVVITTSLLLHGLGLGLIQIANMDYVMAILPRSAQGFAGSLTMFTRTLGVVISISLGMRLFEHFFGNTAIQLNQQFIAAFNITFYIVAAVSGLSWLLITLGIHTDKSHPC